MKHNTEKCLKGCSDLVSTSILSGAIRQILNHRRFLVNSALNQMLCCLFLPEKLYKLCLWQTLRYFPRVDDVRLDHMWHLRRVDGCEIGSYVAPETCWCCELTECDWISLSVCQVTAAPTSGRCAPRRRCALCGATTRRSTEPPRSSCWTSPPSPSAAATSWRPWGRCRRPLAASPPRPPNLCQLWFIRCWAPPCETSWRLCRGCSLTPSRGWGGRGSQVSLSWWQTRFQTNQRSRCVNCCAHLLDLLFSACQIWPLVSLTTAWWVEPMKSRARPASRHPPPPGAETSCTSPGESDPQSHLKNFINRTTRILLGNMNR